jgi:hypothetical protein
VLRRVRGLLSEETVRPLKADLCHSERSEESAVLARSRKAGPSLRSG